VADSEVAELAEGLMVRPAGSRSAQQLNNTASVILELCDGRRTVAQIAVALAEAFGLATDPLAEVTACVSGLRSAGILAGDTAGCGKLDGLGNDPFGFFEVIYCLNLDQRPDRWGAAVGRFSVLGIEKRVERFPAVATPHNHHVGCAMSWRLMVAEARDRGLRNFLGIEDDAIFLDETLEVLRRGVSELEGLPWDLLYLGGAAWEAPVEIPGHTVLQSPRSLTCSHAMAVSRTAYDRLVADIPQADGIEGWIAEYRGWDQYLAQRVNAGYYRAYVLHPRVATQLELTGLAGPDAPLGDRYTIR
jgi:Coenzyme PQQ synthesis protein D (PqqD)